ncbi:hypothetical protein TNCT_265291 [Trichonephila clavata]|uniref:Uncharacterized protein n=1 Tax=Trichonephila clavata TaxID=2740835 RepID=A0A8X6HK35_TRICU|nr:hypothetical protein TNCT_265291 [Trichonephila clavata]
MVPDEKSPENHLSGKQFSKSKHHERKFLKPEDSIQITCNNRILHDYQSPNEKVFPTYSLLPQHHLQQKHKPNFRTFYINFVNECDDSTKYKGKFNCSCYDNQQKILHFRPKKFKKEKTFYLSSSPYTEYEELQKECKNCYHCKNLPYKLKETYDTLDDSLRVSRKYEDENTCCTHVKKKCKNCDCDSYYHCKACYVRSDSPDMVKRNFKVLNSKDQNITRKNINSKIRKRQKVDNLNIEEVVEVDKIDEQTTKTVRKRDRYYKRKRGSKYLEETSRKNMENSNVLPILSNAFWNGLVTRINNSSLTCKSSFVIFIILFIIGFYKGMYTLQAEEFLKIFHSDATDIWKKYPKLSSLF